MKEIRPQNGDASVRLVLPFSKVLGFVLFALLLLPVASPATVTQRSSVVSSRIEGPTFREMPGTPVQLPRAPVVVLSCQGAYLRPLESKNQEISYTFTLYNQTGSALAAVAITDRFDYANFQEAFIFHMRPHELRVVRAIFPSENGNSEIGWTAYRPSFFLCGTGPDQGEDGAIYPFDSLFLRDHRISHLVLLTGPSGNKPITPFVTVRTQFLNSRNESVGVPIQPGAHLELPSYHPGTPGKNLLPFIITACDIKGNSAFVTIYNQTLQHVANAAVSVKELRGVYVGVTSDLRPYELRQIAFHVPSPKWQQKDGNPRVVFCSPGGM